MSLVIGNLNISGNAAGFRNYVTVATTVDLDSVGNGTWTYSNPTITAGTVGTTTIDGYTLQDGDTVLVKNQTSGVQNGIYEASNTGAGVATVLTRVSYLFTGVESNAFITWVRTGTLGNTTSWISSAAPGADIVGTNDPAFVRYDVSSTLSVGRGGTGVTSFTSGNVLVGAGSSAITATKAAPSGDFVGTSDSQTLTNKDLVGATLSLNDSNSAFNLGIVSTSALAADRTLTIDVNNANRTLDLAGNLILSSDLTTAGGFPITITTTGATNVTFPTTGILANQDYVDAVAQGLDVKDSCVAATTVDLNSNPSISGAITYNNIGGVAGTGQITATLAVSNTFIVDGVTFAAADNGSRVLLKNQSNAQQNGIWTTTISGTSLTLNRASDFNSSANVSSGAYTYIEEGTVNISTSWVLTTPDPITVGTPSGSNLIFALFSVSGNVIAGAGLTKTGDTLAVNTSGTTTGIVSNAVVVRSTATAGQVLRSTGTAGAEAAWGAVDLANTSAVTGTLAVGNGGIGTNTLTSNGVLYGNGSGAVQATGSAINSVLVTNGAGTPSLSTTLPSALAIPSAQLSLPRIADSTGGQFYNFAVSDLAADRTITLPLLTTNDTFVFENFTQTLTNKTLVGATLSLDDTASAFNLSLVSTSSPVMTADRTLTFDVSNANRTIDLAGNLSIAADFSTSGANSVTLTSTGATNVTLPTTGTLATLAGTETFTNKTITSARYNQLLDTAGNESLILTATASAVNEFTLANAATGNAPVLSTTGTDTNVNMTLATKGTGVFNFDAGSGSAAIRLLDSAGGEYIGITVPSAVTTYTLTLPSAVGSSGQTLQLTDGAGTLGWVTPTTGAKLSYSITSLQVTATSTVAQAFAYFCWDDSTYGAGGDNIATITVITWINVGANRNLILDVFDGTSVIGTITVTAGTAAGPQTFTVTPPTSDVLLTFRARKNTSGGTSPNIFGIQMEMSS